MFYIPSENESNINPWPAEPSVEPDQLASPEEANRSGFALFALQYMNLCQQTGSSYLIGWKLEEGVAS